MLIAHRRGCRPRRSRSVIVPKLLKLAQFYDLAVQLQVQSACRSETRLAGAVVGKLLVSYSDVTLRAPIASVDILFDRRAASSCMSGSMDKMLATRQAPKACQQALKFNTRRHFSASSQRRKELQDAYILSAARTPVGLVRRSLYIFVFLDLRLMPLSSSAAVSPRSQRPPSAPPPSAPPSTARLSPPPA